MNGGGGGDEERTGTTGKSINVADELKKREVFIGNGDGQYIGNMALETATRI